MTPIVWTLREAADALRVSMTWLRGSDCPRYVIPTTGERSMIRFDPDATRAWLQQWHQRAADRHARVA